MPSTPWQLLLDVSEAREMFSVKGVAKFRFDLQTCSAGTTVSLLSAGLRNVATKKMSWRGPKDSTSIALGVT